MARWGFYGRRRERAELAKVLSRERWFFLQISGRRRIGKTRLVQELLQPEQRERVLYIQIPDSDPAGVVSTARDFMENFGVSGAPPHDLRSLAVCIGQLCSEGWIVALDEFQYFSHKALYPFTSELQSEVDRLAASPEVRGGLIVLGSLHTEMQALLEDRSAPLYQRLTDNISLGHLDVASLLELLQAHADTRPERLLFLWNLFEGVPKFYRDCFEQEVIAADRQQLLERMFFSSSSPLRTEADNWFLREFRGRYDLVLKYVARHPGCTHAELQAHADSVAPEIGSQVGGYLKTLEERYEMVEKRLPVFAKPKARKGHYTIRDNFLRSWLDALAVPTAAINFRPLQGLVEQADQRLMTSEGHGLERLVGQLYEERSRLDLGDFALTSRIEGWWDSRDTEIDLVALDESTQRVRLGSCKRSETALVKDLGRFDGHVARFLKACPKFKNWEVEKVAIAPSLSSENRRAIEAAGYIPQSLVDLTDGLLAAANKYSP
ncbi:MAG: ATP-binding protein [Prochlorococcus sp.]